MNDMVNLSEDGKTVISALDHLTRHITIPQGVEIIGNWALCSLDYLTSVVLLDDVREIGDYAFAGDFSLLNFDIPNSVIKIGSNVFLDCQSLECIHIHITDFEKLNISEYAFNGVNMDECILYVPVGMKQAYSNHPVFGKFKNIEIER